MATTALTPKRARKWIIPFLAATGAVVVLGTVVGMGQMGDPAVPADPIAVRLRDDVLELVFVGQCDTFDVSEFSVSVGRGTNFDDAEPLDLPVQLMSVRNPVTFRLSGSDVETIDGEWLVAFGYVSPSGGNATVEQSLRYKGEARAWQLPDGAVPEGSTSGEFDELARACPK